jgi:uncharacterized protein
MTKAYVAHHLDVRAFARAGATLDGEDALQQHARLMAETHGASAEPRVRWRAQGESRPVPGGADQVWLHLAASATIPLTCQRCMRPVDVPLAVERSFRFVADEQTAEIEDEQSEEDVLALEREFSLTSLIEDELLMELPLVPRHDVCPDAVKMAAVDPEFEAEIADKPNPFAALAGLKHRKLN